jgi:hypothetical protein
MSSLANGAIHLPFFDRKFWDGRFRFTQIGTGAIGGKANGLVTIKDLLSRHLARWTRDPNVEISVPTLAVIATDFFDEFLRLNKLLDLPLSEMRDERIAMAFQQTDLPVRMLGDLRALSEQIKSPLAIRSSSLLEDKIGQPFAGVYATKMIPNNQFDTDSRFHKLTQAIKYVYASTYFREARDYVRSIGGDPSAEKMAVIIQEIVGQRHDSRFYPEVSGVARSYNYYAAGNARPDEGAVSLALGLGKTIVDGGTVWTYSPAHPRISPPFGSIDELMNGTQNQFWALNMGTPASYDPVSESEYLVACSLGDAERDEVLGLVASTFDVEGDRMTPGVNVKGPRVLDFAPMLVLEQVPLNQIIQDLLLTAENVFDEKVEIELALTVSRQFGEAIKIRVGLLQVRPIVVSRTEIVVTEEDFHDPATVLASDQVLGNGIIENIRDVIYVDPETFKPSATPSIADEIGDLNAGLCEENRRYLLIGFGRWGSSHPSLGIPVDWSRISQARAIVESTLPNMNVELSQGSHFFHNLSSFHASYFMLRHDGPFKVDWQWLAAQQLIKKTSHVRHVRLAKALEIRVDGRSGRGVIKASDNADEKNQ